METLFNAALNSYTLVIVGFISVLAFIASPYEIQFEDTDDIEM